LQALADHAGLFGWDVSRDSTIMRAHQHAAGARRCGGQQAEPPGGVSVEPDDHALGRSRVAGPPSCTWPANGATSLARALGMSIDIAND
jgi:hypothetical protein